MPYGKVIYDPLMDAYLCEFPVKGKDGNMRICGKWFRDLARHITRHHGITTRQYKKMLGLEIKETLMSKQTKNKLRAAIKKYKTYKNLQYEKYKLRPGEKRFQNYKRSEQTRKTLRALGKSRKRK